jgi:oligoendopeptidase F
MPDPPHTRTTQTEGVRDARRYFDDLNQQYVRVHQTKEDLFWSTYMAISEDHAAFADAQQAYKAFISDPARLAATRAHLDALTPAGSAAPADLLHGLRGWVRFFEANVIESAEAASLMAELVGAEAALFAKRKALALFHVNEAGQREEATLSMLATNQVTNPREDRRRTSHEALRELETWVLGAGYLDIVGLRNRFARALGYEDFFDYKVRTHERMSPEHLFAILDDFLARTEGANARGRQLLRSRHGDGALLPWNIRFHMTGDVVREMNPYVRFSKALERWVESFRRLGIRFRGATLQLDLLERKGKYQNGFCHGPLPPYFGADGRWIPGRINFTADATPDQVGSGWRALQTLFHEGGHAAHFANVVQNAPCFSQEYAPTSAAYAETQSMFCDSVLEDADWLTRYATSPAGERIPEALVRARIESRTPFLAFDERSLAVVSYFEAAVYRMNDAERTSEAVVQLARDTETRVLGGPGPRPLLAIPHLLNQESSASYHGYLLAHMGVQQTRAELLDRLGYLTDNPRVGPLLAEHYWAPGNSVTYDETLESLTGRTLSAAALADGCNQTVEGALSDAAARMRAAAHREDASDYPDSLDATIRVVDGADVLADNSVSDAAMCSAFERWVLRRYPPGT